MKRVGRVVFAAFLIVSQLTTHASAIESVPTTPNKVAGPFLITGYSFSGPNIRYVQIYNNSSTVASLDGWQIGSVAKAVTTVSNVYISLTGQIAPNKHVVVAAAGIVDKPIATYPLPSSSPSPQTSSVSLIAPVGSSYLDETLTVPTVSVNSPKEIEGASTNYYVRRDVSTTTGNYLSGTTIVVSEKLKNDGLYVAPETAPLQIVEVYPAPPSCSPLDVAETCGDYVKLHNPTVSAVDLSQYRVRTGIYGQLSSSSNTSSLTGELASGAYVSIPVGLSGSGSWVWIEDRYGIDRYEATLMEYPSSTNHEGHSWSYNDELGGWEWTVYPSPGNQKNRFAEKAAVNQCSSLSLSEIAANVATEDQYIEITNTSDSSIELNGCVLQTNRSQTASFVFPAETLAPGTLKVIYVKDTGLTLTKTTSGTVYVLSSDRVTEVDQATYDELHENTTWSLVNGAWNETYAPSPGAMNVWLEYPACELGYTRNLESGLCNKLPTNEDLAECGEGKYRSEETNRCRSIETTLAESACSAGQYRNPETNRCKSLVSTESLLSPCSVGQERNPETNRCRSIASASQIQQCAAGQERNPTTNRCRNKQSTGASDFPIEAVAQSAEATLGWWAFGGVGTLAAGYAGWEWRREVRLTFKKVIRFIPGAR